MCNTNFKISNSEKDAENFLRKLVHAGSYKLLFVMAIRDEYGTELAKLFNPIITGIGPIDAAIVATRVLSVLFSYGQLPDLVISVGSAGSATLLQREVYQVTSVSWRDMDATALGFEKGIPPFSGLNAELPLFTPLKNLPQARLSTGGNVVRKSEYALIDADMVDMETYAILRVCKLFSVPVMGLRGISDGDKDLNCLRDWQKHLSCLDKKLASVVLEIKQLAEKDSLFLSKK